jgi:hypothetical protein
VVHLALLEWIGLGKFNGLFLRAAGGIVTRLLALEASDAREILLGFSVVAMLTIVSTVMSTGAISLESSIVLMAAEVITISFVEMIPMLVVGGFRVARTWGTTRRTQRIRTQGAERGRSWIATKHGDGSLECRTRYALQRETPSFPRFRALMVR